MSGASRLIPLPPFLALLPAGAHFWRSGQPGLAAACLALALLAWSRAAWVRLLLLLVLPLLAARWIWTAGQFVQMRMFMGEPWHRLAAILLGVALLTALAALPLLRQSAQQHYHAELWTPGCFFMKKACPQRPLACKTALSCGSSAKPCSMPCTTTPLWA